MKTHQITVTDRELQYLQKGIQLLKEDNSRKMARLKESDSDEVARMIFEDCDILKPLWRKLKR